MQQVWFLVWAMEEALGKSLSRKKVMTIVFSPSQTRLQNVHVMCVP